MKREINALIIDDLECVASKMRDRLIEVNKKYSDDFIDISPELYIVNVVKGVEIVTKEIKDLIVEHNIKYLLVDRGFSKVVDISYKEELKDIVIEENIYTDRRNKQFRFQADDVFKILSQDHNILNNLLGILIYTNNPIDDVLPEVVHREIIHVLPKGFKKEKLLVLETHREIYKPANSRLHIYEELANHIGIYFHGSKKDFWLYGIFMGDILYNQIRYHFFERKIRVMESSKYKVIGIYLIAFITFVSLNVGCNMLANDWLKQTTIGIDLFVIGLGLIIPVIVIWLKPNIFFIIKEID